MPLIRSTYRIASASNAIGCLFVLLFFFTQLSNGQECPAQVLTSPLNGATNVAVDASISWNPVANIPGYIISLGTTPGGTDILNREIVGSATTYDPPFGLPENTLIYVTVILFDFEGGNIEIPCSSESFITAAISEAPNCTQILFPSNGSTNINPSTNIRWEYTPLAIGYRLSIGTTPGGSDILNNVNLGNTLNYNPGTDFPPETTIYVRITSYNNIGASSSCSEFSFTTGEVAVLPGCTSLINPINGAVNVPLTPILEWVAVPGVTGYRITLGYSPFTAEVLNNTVFPPVNQTGILQLEGNQTFFITIIPFNDAGDAIGCQQQIFSTLQGCGPFFDPLTGDLVSLNPQINFPDTIASCSDDFPLTYTTSDTADGFRWYRIDNNGNESLLSNLPSVTFSAPGEYRYEAYNLIPQSGNLECPTSQLFSVRSSEIPSITAINVTEQANGIRINILVSGTGDYEFAIDNINGPYQDSNTFTNVPYGTHTLYARDKNGCGIAEEQIVQDLTLEGFPKFFSPNGDGVNDYWQYIPPEMSGELTLIRIEVYNRYGQLLVQIDPTSRGWDGTVNGGTLPASDYWFRAIDNTNNELIGHFSLKR